jgi:anti-anti-sigma factor
MPERFDGQASRDFVAELQALPDSGWKCITLDMSETVYMDSSGIGVLVHLYKELMAKAKSLILKKPQRNILNLLTETGIDRLFDVELSSGVKKADAKFDDLNIQLDMKEEIIDDDVCVISLAGVMNYPAGSAVFRKNIFLSIAESNKILLDFQELAFFDPLSIGSILRISRMLMNNGGSMRICNANHVVRNVFEGMGINAIVPFFNSREEALEDWG